MQERTRRQNDKLDLFKCIAIYCVVLIHAPLPGQVGRAVCALAKFAVPLFFLVSGYFSWGQGSEALGRKFRRTGGMLLWSVLLLSGLGCALAAREGMAAADYLRGRMSLFFLRELALYQLLPFPYAWAMWFLAALLLAYGLWWCLTRWMEWRGRGLPYGRLALLALGLLAVHLSQGEVRALRGLEPLSNHYLRNAWLEGIPFFALGGWMGARQEKLRAWGRPVRLWAAFWASTLLALWEFSMVGVLDVYVGTALMAVFLLTIALVCPEVASPWLRRTVCFCGRRLTFFIFVLHVPLLGVVKEWREQIPLFARLLSQPWCFPLWVAGVSTLLALVLWGLSALAAAGQAWLSDWGRTALGSKEV
jgi:surface polysaccharide O-acyltransferase-like enzyme